MTQVFVVVVCHSSSAVSSLDCWFCFMSVFCSVMLLFWPVEVWRLWKTCCICVQPFWRGVEHNEIKITWMANIFNAEKRWTNLFYLFLFLRRLFVVNVSISQLKSLSKMIMCAAFSSHLSILLHMCRHFQHRISCYHINRTADLLAVRLLLLL